MIRNQRVATSITTAAFNQDMSLVAFSPNSSKLELYNSAGKEFEFVDRFHDHQQLITGIDWAPKTNRIVTCSEDRNAYVYEFSKTEKKWKPVLVLLRIQRGATDVKWSPEENKFAVSSGDKIVSVCYFDEDQQWWVSKHIKKFRSTALCVAWSPDNVSLVVGSTDMHVRIFSAHIKEVDQKNPNVQEFGSVILDSPMLSWVQSVAFSPNGEWCACTTHDSRVAFINPANQQIYDSPNLPFVCGAFLSETSYVAAGFDSNPNLFKFDGNQWKFVGEIDTEKTRGSIAEGPTKKSSNFSRSRDLFQQRVTRAQDTMEGTDLKTCHQNCIKTIQVQQGQRFATTGLDGRIVVWPFGVIEKSLNVKL